jgi:hypothetical protein
MTPRPPSAWPMLAVIAAIIVITQCLIGTGY